MGKSTQKSLNFYLKVHPPEVRRSLLRPQYRPGPQKPGGLHHINVVGVTFDISTILSHGLNTMFGYGNNHWITFLVTGIHNIVKILFNPLDFELLLNFLPAPVFPPFYPFSRRSKALLLHHKHCRYSIKTWQVRL